MGHLVVFWIPLFFTCLIFIIALLILLFPQLIMKRLPRTLTFTKSRVAGSVSLIFSIVFAILYLNNDNLISNLKGHWYYQRHLKVESRAKADKFFDSAVGNWANAGNLEVVLDKLKTIDHNSDLWSKILWHVKRAFRKSARLSEWLPYCHQLEIKLTHPLSQSKLYDEIARSYFDLKNDHYKAREYFEKIIKLQADSMLVADAKAWLYELDSLNIGQFAPDFSAFDLQGNEIRLSDFRNKVVLLYFWATWCAWCKPEYPYLRKLNAQYDPVEFSIIAVSLDKKVELVKAYTKVEDIPGSLICDEKEYAGEIARLYNVHQLPTTYIVNREGKIAYKNLRESKLEEAVNTLLLSLKP